MDTKNSEAPLVGKRRASGVQKQRRKHFKLIENN